MLDFIIEKEICTKCGLCAEDCPAKVISMEPEYPSIPEEKEAGCYRCQHCLAICPTGAVSILGINPSRCLTLKGVFPNPDGVEALMRGRRSVRKYKDENLPPELISRLIGVASQAPTGMNSRQVVFTLIDDREVLASFRKEVMEGLGELARSGNLPPGLEFFAQFVKLWEEKGIDVLFRGAPHFIVASAPKSGVSPVPDCMIALSYFELFAQSLGVGTVWDGLAKWTITDLVPSLRDRLGIPEDHVVGYSMAFGWPGVKYSRAVLRPPHRVIKVR